MGDHAAEGVAGDADADAGVDVPGQWPAGVEGEGVGEDLRDVLGFVAVVDVGEVVVEVGGGDDEAGCGESLDDEQGVLWAAAVAVGEVIDRETPLATGAFVSGLPPAVPVAG
ncbi:hypothetical protein [Amycolatopsis sp. NPDC051102]|uniref:hypothetical protein n=1 Tax=Amycolatopsis sp. NPDC051102 TaxID=3155163 RepID=UPI0034283970